MRPRRSIPRSIPTLPALVLVLVPALGGCASGGGAPSANDPGLANVRLGPDYSHWLLGPVARMASPDEIAAFRALEDDYAAIAFVEAFWERRDPDPGTPRNEARLAFERRIREADRRYGEAGVLGRRTPRGTIHVLYGAPESIDHEIPLEGGEPIEVWRYPEDAPPGLDGRPPAPVYRFRKEGDLTVPYQPGGRRTTLPPAAS